MKTPPSSTRFALGVATAVALAFAALATTTFAAGDSAAPAPAQIANAVSESALTTIALTPEAEQRLGITVAAAEKRPLTRTRLFAGQVIAPLAASDSGVSPMTSAFGGADAMRLAEAQVAAEGAVAVALAQLEGARRTLARAQQMLRDDAGSQREVDDARTQLAVAEASLAAAQRQRGLLGSAEVPRAGARFWVRVPVHASDVNEIDAKREARVGGISGRADEAALRALPLAKPPPARSSSPAIDFFYEVRDAHGALRLGQQVGVTLTMRSGGESVVVPWSALVHDAEGGSWVYERVAPNTYARRRVQIEHVVGAEAALAGDALAGREIVSTGVAELFGTEFGSGK